MAGRNREPRAPLFPAIPLSSKDSGKTAALIPISNTQTSEAPNLSRKVPTTPITSQKDRTN